MNKTTNAFEKLFEFNKITLSLNKVIERNSWDQEAIMPTGALADRAEEQASLMIIAHKRQTSNEFSDLLDSVKIERLSKTTKTRGADKSKQIQKNGVEMKPTSMKNRLQNSTKNDA